ncbi:hypothetical protein [Spirochaeta isovalerica]|uniref:Fibronectin type-III domain-containing protein n=1 Tax=Spirochaeta isovalerica TaxID=150 RepID=A0A841RD41_9SPIO|nr:hypothetical protein [Spirochaeta isovalerica]MBB6480910.1 hypothetical protein [Spirochaeta isovalerica]
MKSRLMPLLFLLAGCSASLFEDMSRTIDDPEVQKPWVQSFTEELEIKISWEEDPGADEYVLYRADDNIGTYEKIYQGTSLEFFDSDVSEQGRYLYTLVKMRGEEAFGPSLPVLGVASMTMEDEFESNDREENATPFLYDLSANVQYYADNTKQHILEDRDWYSVEVGPRRSFTFQVLYTGTGSQELEYYCQPETPQGLDSESEITIVNTTMESKIFNFCIYPYGANILTGSSGGGKIIQYDLDFTAEQEL